MEPFINNRIKDAKSFCRQPRRDEGAYPQGSVTEEQRRMAAKGRAEWVLLFMNGS